MWHHECGGGIGRRYVVTRQRPLSPCLSESTEGYNTGAKRKRVDLWGANPHPHFTIIDGTFKKRKEVTVGSIFQ